MLALADSPGPGEKGQHSMGYFGDGLSRGQGNKSGQGECTAADWRGSQEDEDRAGFPRCLGCEHCGAGVVCLGLTLFQNSRTGMHPIDDNMHGINVILFNSLTSAMTPDCANGSGSAMVTVLATRMICLGG